MNDDLLQLEARVQRLLDRVERDCPSLYTKDVRQLVAVREWKVAVEILCDLLLEDGWRLPEASAQSLADVATRLGVAPKYWQALAANH
jgi:hypothetical protein